jgi:hypothetical protein
MGEGNAESASPLRDCRITVVEHSDLLRRESFDVHQAVVSFARDPDQFVELGLQGEGIAVLRRLDEEHHEEGDDGCAGI